MGGGFCFWGFIDGTLKATCCPMVDQEGFYSGHKRRHGFKYQSIETPDGLVSSLMGSFIGRRGDWKMMEYSRLADRLREVNGGRRPAHALYLYSSPAYPTMDKIMGPYKNYLGKPRTAAQNQFNTIMSRLQIEVEHGFAIHRNLWAWNGFHLGSKLRQVAAVCYAVSVLFANIWTCIRCNLHVPRQL